MAHRIFSGLRRSFAGLLLLSLALGLGACGHGTPEPTVLLAPGVTLEDQQEAEGLRVGLPDYLEMDPARFDVQPAVGVTRVTVRGVAKADREMLRARIKYFEKQGRFQDQRPLKPIQVEFD